MRRPVAKYVIARLYLITTCNVLSILCVYFNEYLNNYYWNKQFKRGTFVSKQNSNIADVQNRFCFQANVELKSRNWNLSAVQGSR